MTKKKLIIDCDTGIDDAQAILIALSQDVEVLAITCVAGNVTVENVCVNVLKVLEVCERTDIPVYKGATCSMLGEFTPASHFHGHDGLGDAEGIPHPDMSLLKSEHAVNALIRLVNEHPGEITLVAMGPLTNIALACRLDPSICSKLKNLVIMGGNIEAKGNMFVSAEFNFHADVEAAYVVLNEVTSPISLVTWEVCLNHAFALDFCDVYISQGTRKSHFAKKISHKLIEFYNKKELAGMGIGYTNCDCLAMVVAVKPDIVSKESSVYASVERHGHLTLGQMVVDWRGHLGKKHNVMIVQEVDMESFKDLMIKSVQ
ncbi:nucleoside hydrolase-like [Montipora capricornis]|uniref:nucleoside hydrolase-like n=1 Tax=Montipora capricornis TaxID=246305 RepID=UPI0035F1BC6C